jgi:hypothetical protein
VSIAVAASPFREKKGCIEKCFRNPEIEVEQQEKTGKK